MTHYLTKALTTETWPGFAALAEAHNGVWGGCWCMGFHPEGVGRHKTPARNRAEKQARVRAGAAHAALVFDGKDCVGWCQFGAPAELPRIKNRKAYEAALTDLPDWRVTCFFVANTYRRKGVGAAALAGALDQIAALGGGLVEGYPEETEDRKIAGSFLFNGAMPMFETLGFSRTRRIGKFKWVVSKIVAPVSGAAV